MGVSHRVDCVVAGSVLQHPDCWTIGLGVNRQRTRERGVDGCNFARDVATRWFPLAVDVELGDSDRDQHVALPVVSPDVVP